MSRKRVLAVVGVCGAALATASVLVVLVFGRGSSTPPAPGALDVQALLAGIPQSGASLGSLQAPVTLFEYADLQCPYCAGWARAALPTVVERYVRTGKVRIVFRGLAFLGPDSETALRAAVAAGRQDRMWNVVELFFQNQGDENAGWVTRGLVESVAASVPGLASQRVFSEQGGRAVTDEIVRTAAEADAVGIDSTPAFLAQRRGGPLRRLDVQSLDAQGIAPSLDALLAS